jgi:hypothetical protein
MASTLALARAWRGVMRRRAGVLSLMAHPARTDLKVEYANMSIAHILAESQPKDLA